MFKFIVPTIIIVISVALFFGFTEPFYQSISSLRQVSSSYNQALSNSKELKAERDTLTAQYNTMNSDDLAKLDKLMPDSVDTIHFILEMENIAAPYGMVLKDIKYDTSSQGSASGSTASTTATTTGSTSTTSTSTTKQTASSQSPYGTWNMQFSTQGTYSNFIGFLKNLESNLRIIDVSSISFSSQNVPGLNPNLPQAYKYSVSINTYWLKN